MKKETQEIITGLILGLILTLLLAIKVIAAPVSDDEVTLIAKTVQAEAGNQCFEGKRLVAAVILNRVDSEVFPDTVEGVLSAPGQFVTYKSLGRTQPTIHDMMAVQMELNERSNAEVMFFRAGRYGTGKPMMQVGDHYFSTIK